jgi:folate-dependent phosphoribosylglycinamide formyltransferase PurN
MAPRILILSGKSQFVEFIYNGLRAEHAIEKVIIENDVAEKVQEQRRRKKIGFSGVIGQRLFATYIVGKLKKKSGARVREIIKQTGLNGAKIPAGEIEYVPSVNASGTIELIVQLHPDLIIVNGTRILSKKFLSAITCPIVNIHGGITPQYRGLAGSYWALANGELDKCGSTIHLVDEGVDTGAILYQDTINITAADNYLTYTFLQLPKEIAMLKKVIADIESNNLKPIVQHGVSGLWYEPTIWQYWYNKVVKKVK